MDSSFLNSVINTETPSSHTFLDAFEEPLPRLKFDCPMDPNQSLELSHFAHQSGFMDMSPGFEIASLKCKQPHDCQEYDKYV